MLSGAPVTPWRAQTNFFDSILLSLPQISKPWSFFCRFFRSFPTQPQRIKFRAPIDHKNDLSVGPGCHKSSQDMLRDEPFHGKWLRFSDLQCLPFCVFYVALHGSRRVSRGQPPMKQAICPCPQQICISSELSCFVLLVSVRVKEITETMWSDMQIHKSWSHHVSKIHLPHTWTQTAPIGTRAWNQLAFTEIAATQLASLRNVEDGSNSIRIIRVWPTH